MAAEELSFTYFPDNYRWSHGLLIGLNMAPWGGAEIGEVNRIGLRLKEASATTTPGSANGRARRAPWRIAAANASPRATR